LSIEPEVDVADVVGRVSGLTPENERRVRRPTDWEGRSTCHTFSEDSLLRIWQLPKVSLATISHVAKEPEAPLGSEILTWG
jgi:hypothetical protein